MNRRTLLNRGLIFLTIAAVILALVVFKVRVAVAGGKYVLTLVVVVLAVWLISRGLQRKS